MTKRRDPRPVVASFQPRTRNHKLVPVAAVDYGHRKPNFVPLDFERNQASSTSVAMAATCPTTCYFYGKGVRARLTVLQDEPDLTRRR